MQLYANKLDKLENMDRCLKTHHRTESQGNGDSKHNKIARKVESVIKPRPEKGSRPSGFLGE